MVVFQKVATEYGIIHLKFTKVRGVHTHHAGLYSQDGKVVTARCLADRSVRGTLRWGFAEVVHFARGMDRDFT